MDKLQWFKFAPSDWMMGKIQRCNEVTQARFMRLCCLYWNKECNLNMEDSIIEIDQEHYDILIKKKIISCDDEHIFIDFLDEQMVGILDTSSQRRKAANARWDKVKAKGMQVHASALQSDADKIREEEKREDKKIKEFKILLSSMSLDKKKCFDLWMVYRKEIKKPIKVESTLKTLIERFNLEPIEKIKYVIQKSIENNYVGLFWDNYNGQKTEVADTEQMYWVSSRGNPKTKMTKAAMDKYIKSDGSQLMDIRIIKIQS